MSSLLCGVGDMAGLIADQYGMLAALVQVVATALCSYDLNDFFLLAQLHLNLEARELRLGTTKWWGLFGCLGPCLLFLSLPLTPTSHYTIPEHNHGFGCIFESVARRSD